MASEQPPGDPPGPVTLQQLIRETGHVEDRRIDEFVRRAAALQRRRHEDGVSDTDHIPRTAGLWILMSLDPAIKTAVESGGISQYDLSVALSLTTIPAPAETDSTELNDTFARAMRAYLSDRPLQPAIDLMDVCAAILRDSRDQPGGLLPGRLKDFDYDAVLSVVDRFGTSPRQSPDGGTDPPPLSESMRGVAAQLSGGAESSAGTVPIKSFTIAQAIAAKHPEYAASRLGAMTFDPALATITHTWAEWENEVGGLYDRETLARTTHEVLVGRLFLVGLALVDPALHQALAAAGVWTPLLLEVDEEAAPQGSRLWSALQEIQFDYGYQSDQATGEDQLGIQGEVNAVCAVITDRAVTPPLAVGLFGEWGTGKSFFMDKMREQVSRLTRPSTDPASPDPTNTDPTSADPKPLNVIQIRFNAWHYADSSLWSSLAIEIFERLVDPEPVGPEERLKWLRLKGDPKQTEREDLLTQLETFRGARAALDAERALLVVERDKLAARREQASKEREKAVKEASLTDVARELAKRPEVTTALDDISAQLGLKPAVTELRGMAGELRTTAGYLPAVWRLVQHKTWTVTLAATFFVLALATAALVLRSGWAWVGSVGTAIGSVAAVVVAASQLVKPAARKVNKALEVIEAAIHTTAEIEAALRSEREQEERNLELTLAETAREITQATEAIAALDEKIAATRAAADALTVGRRLYDFLADRAAGYQKHQGVVGMLHRDFRLLDAQLEAYRKTGEPQPGWPPADRVILYIDDLDRCPPAKVLEVLEAVHLLLALELFVVVVGVDPRWLQRSLRHQYRDLVTSGDPRTDPYLRAMPIEYLEKIFQIPLTLPVMEPTGYARLIASLAPTTTPSAPAVADPATPSTTRRASSNESPGGDRAPTRALLDVQAGSAASGTHGQPIDLTSAEVGFAQQLGPLVDSPRAAKRLMNTYRLIRATRHVGSRSRFLGTDGRAGEYQAVLTLLAVAAGYPTMADRLLVALEDDAATHDIHKWPDFVAALKPATTTSQPGHLVPSDLAKPPAGDDRDESALWANMHTALQACLPTNTLTQLEPYQRWGKIAARFSFTL